jgi:hypothetical protein
MKLGLILIEFYATKAQLNLFKMFSEVFFRQKNIKIKKDILPI